MLLARYPVPVVPVHLEGTRESLPAGRYVPRPGRIQITFGAPLDPHKLQKKGKGKEPYERITSRIGGHHLVPDVHLHDLDDGRLNGQERQVTNEGQPLCTALQYAAG